MLSVTFFRVNNDSINLWNYNKTNVVTLSCKMIQFGVPTGIVQLDTKVENCTHCEFTFGGTVYVCRIANMNFTASIVTVQYNIDVLKTYKANKPSTDILICSRTSNLSQCDKFLVGDVPLRNKCTTKSVIPSGTNLPICLCVQTTGMPNVPWASLEIPVQTLVFTQSKIGKLNSYLHGDLGEKLASMFQTIFVAPVNTETCASTTLKVYDTDYNVHDTGISCYAVQANTFSNYSMSLDSVWSNPSSYLDYPPYTTISVHVPYVGDVKLNQSIMNSSGNSIDVSFDLIGGNAIARLVTNTGVIEYLGSNSFGSIPLNYKDSSITAGQVSGMLSLISSALSVSGDGMGALSTLATGALNQATSYALSNLKSMLYTGSVKGLSSLTQSAPSAYVVRQEPIITLDSYIVHNGQPTYLVNPEMVTGYKYWFSNDSVITCPVGINPKSILVGGIIA